jgi:hypothetical protein
MFVRLTVGYQEGSPSMHSSPFQFIEQDREEHYRETHLQTVEFQIARLIVDQLTVAGADAKDRRRRVLALQSRHQLFPQVFRYVDDYVRCKVNFQNCDPCELGLAKYVQRIVERLRDGIVPDESEGEAPLMPITNRYKPIGTTAEVDFKTTRLPRDDEEHIATHGWFRQDSPMFSSISLGDSQLSLFDLYQLDLPAELVTLSGCGTGLNVVVGGDELLGLVRGLLYAGAQGVLVTLWDVNDQSTAEFMKLFYERLKTNPNKAQAVQHATAEIRKKYAHPFYWAPFVLVGKYG